MAVEEGASEFGGGIAFVQPPDGMTADDFVAASLAPPDESGVGTVAATPIEGAEASPADEQPASEMPETDLNPDAVGPDHYSGTGRGEDQS